MTAQTPPLSTAVSHNGRLAGKRVLITGTGGGQGAVAQELFCNHGAHVIGCDVRPGAAAATAAALSAQGLSAEGTMSTSPTPVLPVTGWKAPSRHWAASMSSTTMPQRPRSHLSVK